MIGRVSVCVGVVVTFASTAARGQLGVDFDVPRVRAVLEQELALGTLERAEDAWAARRQARTGADADANELFGYDPPGRAVQVAWLWAFLYAQSGRDDDAVAAADAMVRMADYRDAVPAEAFARAEYASVRPAVPSFFLLAEYAEAYARIRTCDALTADHHAAIREAIATSAEFIFVFPEWGPHNRAALRAECLLHASLACPEAEGAPRWRRMAAILAEDSLAQWEVEDASSYQPIWWWALTRYAEASGDRDAFDPLFARASLRAAREWITPAGHVADFGDSWWGGSGTRHVRCFAWGAARFQDPTFQWAAERIYAAMGPTDASRPGLGRALLYAQLLPVFEGAVGPPVSAVTPPVRSGPAFDEVLSKKVVLRSGWGANDTFLLLNYRDEGDWGRVPRDYLRQTLAVEEEKMHHGHADENAIVLWMHDGSVLLHDAGYRERLPSGPYGAYRGDLFHDRLVVRQGTWSKDQSLFDHLADSGAYVTTRTESLDFVETPLGMASRTRMVDETRGVTCDRTLVHLPEWGAMVVFDTVRADRDGYLTLAALWASQDHVEAEERATRGRTRSMRGRALGGHHDLLVLAPETGANAGEVHRFPLRRHAQEEHVTALVESRWFDAGSHAILVSVLLPLEEDATSDTWRDAVAWVPTSEPDRAAAVRLTGGAVSVLIGVKADLTFGTLGRDARPRYDAEAGSIRYGNVWTDASLLLVRDDDASRRWEATHMTHVRGPDGTWMEASPSHFFQTSGRSDHVGRSRWRRWGGVRPRGD